MIAATPHGVILTVRVVPRAARSGLADVRDGALRVRLHASPVDGAANAELIALLADVFGISKSAVSIPSGSRSRSKKVELAGIDEARVRAALRATGVAGLGTWS